LVTLFYGFLKVICDVNSLILRIASDVCINI
jgi:hypothetical protein